MVKKEEKATTEKKKKKKQKKIGRLAVNKGAWTAEEDQKLVDYVAIHGDKKWNSLAAKAGLSRCGKSCRLRWLNYLRPGIKRGNISEEEEDLIIRLHNLIGNRWSLIAGRLPGRTDNEIKNHWNTYLSKRSLSIHDLNSKMAAGPAVITAAVVGLERGVEEEELNCCDPYAAAGHCLLDHMPLHSPAGDPSWVDSQQELLYVLSPPNRDGGHAAGEIAGVDDQDYDVTDCLGDFRFIGCDYFFAF